jgi:two-component system, LytTR family, response regulator
VELIENYMPEIVFLDINMPGMNGFELLQALAWKDFNLVFTTAHQEYALQALKNNAIDYLLKPIDPEDLQAAVARILAKTDSPSENSYNYHKLLASLTPPDRNRLLISSRDGIDALRTEEISYLESHSNYTDIHLADSRVIASSKTLKDFDSLLCGSRSVFMRVHHSFIVNLDRVTRYLKASECLVLHDDKRVPVARSRREEFFRWMNV